MQENILETKSMDLVSIALPMATVMRGHGMKAESKAMACILSGTAIVNVVSGIAASLSTLYRHLQMQFFELCRYFVYNIEMQPISYFSALTFVLNLCFSVVKSQGARRTAEKAISLRRADEQVNKAVMAANRAATAARVAAVKAVQNRMDGKFCDTNVEEETSFV